MLGAPISVLLRMGLNVFIDSLFDAVPVIGMLFDFAFKANVRNLSLLRQSLGASEQVAKTSKWVVGIVLAVILGVVLLSVLIVFAIAALIYQQVFA